MENYIDSEGIAPLRRGMGHRRHGPQGLPDTTHDETETEIDDDPYLALLHKRAVGAYHLSVAE